jgi:hypothetical protein
MNGLAQKVTITDIRVPFTRLVFFFVKATLAVIPAALILAAIGFAVSAIVIKIMGGGPPILL